MIIHVCSSVLRQTNMLCGRRRTVAEVKCQTTSSRFRALKFKLLHPNDFDYAIPCSLVRCRQNASLKTKC